MLPQPSEEDSYAAFVESMAQHCHCSPQLRPCDGVLCGGVCDGIDLDRNRSDRDEEDD